MERCPKKLKERMEKMRQRALDLVQKAQERGKPKESEALSGGRPQPCAEDRKVHVARNCCFT